MNNLQKFLLVGAFGLLCTTFVLIAIDKTSETYQSVSLDTIKVLAYGSRPKVLGASVTVITITNPGSGSVVAAGTTGVPLTATTDQMASCKYGGGSADDFGAMSPFDQTGSTTHTSILSPLANGNSYTIYVQCQNGEGNITPKAVTYFSVAMPTAMAQDNTLPVISNIKIESISPSSTVISWTTDEATDAQIEYGPIDAYGSFTVLADSSPKTTNHTVTMNSLLPGFTYHYRLRSRDAGGNLAVTGDRIVTTLPQTSPLWFTASSVPPQTTSGDFRIYQAYANFIAQDSAAIYWFTDWPARSQVEYGTTPGYGTSTQATELLRITHGVDLKNLTPNTTYHYRIIATDYSGYKGYSGDGWFTTLASSAPATTPVVPSSTQEAAPPGLAMPAASLLPAPPVTLPANVKEGQVIKFSKSKAVFLVKSEGLYPFDSMTSLEKYQQKSRQKIRYFSGSPDKYTIVPESASAILGL